MAALEYDSSITLSTDMKMSRQCNNHYVGLVAAAIGQPAEAAEAHAAKCRACKALLADLRKVAAAAATPLFDAPDEVIGAAKSIVEGGARRLRAKLIFSSLAPAGVTRSVVGTSFQLVFEAQGATIRVMYLRQRAGWEVLGKMEGVGWEVKRGKRAVACDAAGKFSFKAASLSSTGLTVAGHGLQIVVPAASEVIHLDPSTSR